MTNETFTDFLRQAGDRLKRSKFKAAGNRLISAADTHATPGVFPVTAFGDTTDGVNHAPAVLAAQTAAEDNGGGEVSFPNLGYPYTIRDAPIPVNGRDIDWVGTGTTHIDFRDGTEPGLVIADSVPGVARFNLRGLRIDYRRNGPACILQKGAWGLSTVERCFFGAGSQGARVFWHDTALHGNSGHLDMNWTSVELAQAPGSSVPLWEYVSGGGDCNANTFTRLRFQTNGGAITAPCFVLRHTNTSAYQYGNGFYGLNFESPHGGAMHFAGVMGVTLDRVEVYDAGTITDHLIRFDRGPGQEGNINHGVKINYLRAGGQLADGVNDIHLRGTHNVNVEVVAGPSPANVRIDLGGSPHVTVHPPAPTRLVEYINHEGELTRHLEWVTP